jgi:hypothetical protein
MAYFTSNLIALSGMWNRLLILLLAIVMGSSCESDPRLPFGTAPEIELAGISNDTIREYQDILTITIKYLDGDGDLGFEDPDQYALFVRDQRLENFDQFYIGPISPPGNSIAIEGELDIEFPSLFLFGNGNVETTRFEVKMIDRAGNESNILTTQRVFLIRE